MSQTSLIMLLYFPQKKMLLYGFSPFEKRKEILKINKKERKEKWHLTAERVKKSRRRYRVMHR